MEATYRRKRAQGLNFIEAQAEAHKIAFYPMLFQAIRSLDKLGILGELVANKTSGLSKEDLLARLDISDYAMSLLLETGVKADVLLCEGDLYKPSKLGIYLFEDESVRINMNFMHELCYQGAFYLEDSLKNARPEGLKVFGEWETIYQALSQLPRKAHDSWFQFDNFYSDLAFDEALPYVLQSKPRLLYDIGGNTARFDLKVLQADASIRVRIFDLEPQLAKASQTLKNAGLLDRAELCTIDFLEAHTEVPAGADVIWMSQFLDCFTPRQIVTILGKLQKSMAEHTRLFILEPFIDQQNKVGALALLNTSFYFACMANGNSRMYNQADMLEFIAEAGLKNICARQGIGKMNYTLLECALA